MKNISWRYYSSAICMQMIRISTSAKTALTMLAFFFFFLNGMFTDQSARCFMIFQQWKSLLITAGKQKKRCWGMSARGSLHSHLQFFWWNRGSVWPWIWICRPSTGRRHSHLLFVQPAWKKKREREKKHAGGGIKLMYVCHEHVAFASSLAY